MSTTQPPVLTMSRFGEAEDQPVGERLVRVSVDEGDLVGDAADSFSSWLRTGPWR